MPTPTPAYIYDAIVIKWVDGDTCWLAIDLGWRIVHSTPCRLLGVNTPERGQPGWAEATAYARELAPAGSPVVVVSQPSSDKYGRRLVTIHAGQVDVNRALLDGGYAVPYDGGPRT